MISGSIDQFGYRRMRRVYHALRADTVFRAAARPQLQSIAEKLKKRVEERLLTGDHSPAASLAASTIRWKTSLVNRGVGSVVEPALRFTDTLLNSWSIVSVNPDTLFMGVTWDNTHPLSGVPMALIAYWHEEAAATSAMRFPPRGFLRPSVEELAPEFDRMARFVGTQFFAQIVHRAGPVDWTRGSARVRRYRSSVSVAGGGAPAGGVISSLTSTFRGF